jgi:hypothetical protein
VRTPATLREENTGAPMAISHELSSEIATALFTAKEKSQSELVDLKEMVLQIHSTLEQLGDQANTTHAEAEVDSEPLTKVVGQQF